MGKPFSSLSRNRARVIARKMSRATGKEWYIVLDEDNKHYIVVCPKDINLFNLNRIVEVVLNRVKE